MSGWPHERWPANPRVSMDFERAIRPPFLTLIGGSVQYGEVFDDLVDALDLFVRLGLPPTPKREATVMDVDGTIIVGVMPSATIAGLHWFGVSEAFDELRQHRLVDFIEVEGWEMQARGAAPEMFYQ